MSAADGYTATEEPGHDGPCPARRIRGGFVHNVIAHPLLWCWPSIGRKLHDRTAP